MLQSSVFIFNSIDKILRYTEYTMYCLNTIFQARIIFFIVHPFEIMNPFVIPNYILHINIIHMYTDLIHFEFPNAATILQHSQALGLPYLFRQCSHFLQAV